MKGHVDGPICLIGVNAAGEASERDCVIVHR